jgi:hypothetical protein
MLFITHFISLTNGKENFSRYALLYKLGKTAVLSHVYGVPLKEAMVLICTLCQAGRNMASILVITFTLYIYMHPLSGWQIYGFYTGNNLYSIHVYATFVAWPNNL